MSWWLWVIIIVAAIILGVLMFGVIGALAISSRISIAEEYKEQGKGRGVREDGKSKI